MSFSIQGIVVRNETNGALQFKDSNKLITPIFEEHFNGDTVELELYINESLYEGRSFKGILTAMYTEENNGVDETIIIMENDGCVDDIVDILHENLNTEISIVVN